jgi:DNA-binding protein HU-beta
MNRSQVIAEVAKANGWTKKDAKVRVIAVIDEITKALANGEKVKIANFGTFDTYTRKERNGTNPRTQEKLVIPAKNVARFKASNALNASVDNDVEVEEVEADDVELV